MTRWIRLSLAAAALALAPHGQLWAQLVPHHQTDFPAAELIERRARVFEAIGDDAIVLIQGAPNVQGFHEFRQSNTFYYLTGVEVPHAYLLMDGRSGTSRLYLPHANSSRQRGEGVQWSADNAGGGEGFGPLAELTGIDTVLGVDLLPYQLWRYVLRSPFPTLYTMLSPAEGAAQSRDEILIGLGEAFSDPWDGRPSREGAFVATLHERYPQLEIADLTPILDRLRIVKSTREIELIRRASRLAALGIMEAIRSTGPEIVGRGLYEYQLDAAARYVFLAGGARGEAYRSITATGTNAFFGHYFRNSSRLEPGELVLMDYAPDFRYYTSDVARMWPVSGTFDPEQRELYGWILAYYHELQQHIRPGVTADQVMDETALVMTERFEAASWSKPEYREAARGTLSFRGHLSHPVGMAVHDVGEYRSRPLEPGIVFSIDPMLWVPEERLYVRLEDVGVVTATGFENFSGFAPVEMADVEALIREQGVLEKVPPVDASNAPSREGGTPNRL